MKNYEHEIIRLLNECNNDKGLSLVDIVRNVYNMSGANLFNPFSYEEVENDVKRYLRNETQKKGGLIERTVQRGFYRLNMKSQVVQQLILDFQVAEEDEWMM